MKIRFRGKTLTIGGRQFPEGDGARALALRMRKQAVAQEHELHLDDQLRQKLERDEARLSEQQRGIRKVK